MAMIQAIGSAAYRARWWVLAIWLAACVVATIALPDLASVVAHDAVPNLPNSSSVMQAENALTSVDPAQRAVSSAVLVLQSKHRLRSAQLAYFAATIQRLGAHKAEYNLASIVDAATAGPALRAQFISKDGSTAIAVVGFRTSSMSDATMN